MGQGMSCRVTDEHGLFSAVQCGDLEMVEAVLAREPVLVHQTTVYDRHSALHIAAANGQIEVVNMLLNISINPDVLNRYKQTPLMLAAMHGKITCVHKLIEGGANILKFNSLYGRTCLHYAAYYGHSDCLETILSAARTSHVSVSWGFARFVNVRDGKGATPLHLASRQRRPDNVRLLLNNGALVCASTGGYGFPGSTPLHLAARGGSLDCIRELLAWGGDRIQRDAFGRIPYMVGLRHNRSACATLLNPLSAEPIVWPSHLKFISELNEDTKALLERALMDANKEREKIILKGTSYILPSPSHSEANFDDDNISEGTDTGLYCICFDQLCTIEVQDCGHQMCAQCVLSLCCHNKPNPTTAIIAPPVCPFFRSNIERLSVIVKVNDNSNNDTIDHLDTNSKVRKVNKRSHNISECGGSSSFKGLSAVGSFGRITNRGSGKIAEENASIDTKELSLDY